MFVKSEKGEKIRSYALLDGGSNRHVVSKGLCAKLGIVGKEKCMSVATLESSIESVREIADVIVEGVNGAPRFMPRTKDQLGQAVFTLPH